MFLFIIIPEIWAKKQHLTKDRVETSFVRIRSSVCKQPVPRRQSTIAHEREREKITEIHKYLYYYCYNFILVNKSS